MDSASSKKIVTLGFLAVAFLAALVVRVSLEAAAGASGWVASLYAKELFRHGIQIFVALATFALLQFNPRAHAIADEAVLEISKVVWPSKKETWAMTVVACIMLAVAALLLSLLDFVSTGAVRALLTM